MRGAPGRPQYGAAHGRGRSPSEYSYSDDEPPGVGGAWGGSVGRAGPSGPAPSSRYQSGYAQGPPHDAYYQTRHDPYAQPPSQRSEHRYDPYSHQPSGKGGGSGYPPPPAYGSNYPPPPGYGGAAPPPPPPSHQDYGPYGSYSPYGPPPPGYGAPPAYGAPPGYSAGYPPPPGYAAPNSAYSYGSGYPDRYGGRYNSIDRGRRDRSRSGGRGRSRSRGKGGKRRPNNNRQGQGKKGGGGDGEPRKQGGGGGGGKNKKQRGEEGDVDGNDIGPKPDLNLAEVLSKIETSAMEKTGSMFLQITLKERNPEETSSIFHAILPVVRQLAYDQFGNFVVQKLLENSDEDQREALSQELSIDAMKTCNEKYGCRVMQKAIEVLDAEMQTKVVSTIKASPENVMTCIKSMHGNHVIQVCVQKMPLDSLGWIIEAVESDVEFIANHMYGCRVVQRLCERCDPHEHLVGILDGAVKLVDKLSQDQHGNYVVQCVLQHGRLEDKRHILQAVRERPIFFAKNKCSSNVVERCMEIAAESEELAAAREELLGAFIGRPGDPNAPLRQLMEDKFGNFIVQKMLKHSRGDAREALRKELEAEEPTLRASQSGRHILTTMQKEFG